MNLLKSAIYFSPKIIDQIKQSIMEILSIVELTEAVHYLMIPLFKCRLHRANIAEFVASICACLEGWQSRTLLMMARVIFIRLVFSAVPINLLSYTIVSKSVLALLE